MKPKLRFKEFSDEYIEILTNDIFNEITDFVAAGSFADLRNKVKYNSEKDYAQLIRTVDIKNKYTGKDFVYINESAYNFLWRVNLDKDAIILPNIGANIGEYYYINSNQLPYKKCALGPNAILLRSNNYNMKYLYNILGTKKFQSDLLNIVGASGQPKFNKTDLKKIKLIISNNINEQNKISNMLSLLDNKIELQSKKIENLKLFKSYTKNKLFQTGDKTIKLGEILTKWNKKNKDSSIDYVESISNKYGFISQSDQFEDRNVASKDLKNYYVIEKNVFGYNPSRLNVGSLALKDNDNVSVVSPLYECFTTNQNNKFMLEWFDSVYFKKGTLSKIEGGVRNTLNFTNLCNIEISLPSIELQNKYADYLSVFDKKIKLEEQKLNYLKKLKTGLMQNMFV